MSPPKVLVGCPISDHKAYCFDRYVNGLHALTYAHKDVLLVDNSKDDTFFKTIQASKIPVQHIPYLESARERLIQSRNILRQTVLDGGYDYFLSLECDIIPPKDIIERLLAHDKKVISGVYFKPFSHVTESGKVIKREVLPVAYKKHSEKSTFVHRLTYEHVRKDAVLPVAIVGLGCMLIHRSIFEEGTQFRIDPKRPEVFDDTHFCVDVREKGHTIFLDTSLKCMHLLTGGTDWKDIQK